MANNEKKKSNNTIVHDTICLFMITLVAGLILGGVYTITKKPIQTQEAKTKAEAYATVFSGADFAEDADLNKALDSYQKELTAGKIQAGDENLSDTVISEIMKAQVDGQDAGYVLTCAGKGYGGMVTIALGIDLEGNIKGIQITDNSNETPGLGKNSSNTDWNSQYVGMNTSQELCVKKDGTGNTKNGIINAISGATITSKAVTRATNAALGLVKSLSE